MQYTRCNILFSLLGQFCQLAHRGLTIRVQAIPHPFWHKKYRCKDDFFYLQGILGKVTSSIYNRGKILLRRISFQKIMITLNCDWILPGSLVCVVSFTCSQMTMTKSNWKTHFTSQAPTQLLCLIPFSCPGSPPSCCKRSHCELKDRKCKYIKM